MFESALNVPKVTAHTASLIEFNVLLNSVVSTPDSRFMSLDISDFYLGTPLPELAYMMIHRRCLSAVIIERYHLEEFFHHHHVYVT